MLAMGKFRSILTVADKNSPTWIKVSIATKHCYVANHLQVTTAVSCSSPGGRDFGSAACLLQFTELSKPCSRRLSFGSKFRHLKFAALDLWGRQLF